MTIQSKAFGVLLPRTPPLYPFSSHCNFMLFLFSLAYIAPQTTMNALRLARTLNVRSVSSPATLGRSLATATTLSQSSMIPVSNIEAQWASLSNKEQMEVYEQLLEVQKKDWKTMSLDEKKAGACRPLLPRQQTQN